jgi:hypothetical protein
MKAFRLRQNSRGLLAGRFVDSFSLGNIDAQYANSVIDFEFHGRWYHFLAIEKKAPMGTEAG